LAGLYSYFCTMQNPYLAQRAFTTHNIQSGYLQRAVQIDVYGYDAQQNRGLHLLLLNDGQDLHQFHFLDLLHDLRAGKKIMPLVCVGIHAGPGRMQDYGIASSPDYAGRGANAGAYAAFVLQELFPLLHTLFGAAAFLSVGYAGFSLGGLTALDTAWHHPHLFQIAGVFSGSLWWRSRNLGDGYDDDQHRIMHQLIRQGTHHPGQRFYFTTGSLDETADRNGNGIIDSIDDTLDLVRELEQKGYGRGFDLCYTNYEDGRHDVATWGRMMPSFLIWGWGIGQ
jgi:iron(III)-enterobactin esterase